MKIAVVLLCLLGIVAAACAAFLVNGMKLPAAMETRIAGMKPAEDKTEVQVLFATRMIPAMTVIDSRLVVARSMPKHQAPQGYMSNTVDVVGRVLATPLVEGQPFTAACFAGDKASRIVAEAIPKGKRAVGISVTDYAGLEGMLYPGSTVDVMASFKSLGNEWRDSVTTTLLENIQVLGIEQQTVVSPGKTMGDGSNTGRTTRRVTLLVDTKQAKALQLAMEHGTLSLALRNPMDDGEANRDAVSVSRLLGIGGGNSAPRVGNDFNELFQMVAKAAATANARMDAAAQKPAPPAKDPFAAAPATKPVEPPPQPKWEVTVIRGETTSTQNFPMPATRPAETPEPAAGPETIQLAEPESIKPVSMNR